jgi:hypothetical protein
LYAGQHQGMPTGLSKTDFPGAGPFGETYSGLISKGRILIFQSCGEKLVQYICAGFNSEMTTATAFVLKYFDDD